MRPDRTYKNLISAVYGAQRGRGLYEGLKNGAFAGSTRTLSQELDQGEDCRRLLSLEPEGRMEGKKEK